MTRYEHIVTARNRALYNVVLFCCSSLSAIMCVMWLWKWVQQETLVPEASASVSAPVDRSRERPASQKLTTPARGMEIAGDSLIDDALDHGDQRDQYASANVETTQTVAA